MEKAAQQDQLRQLALFWERATVPQWDDLSEPTRVEAVKLLAQLLREALAHPAALRGEGAGDE